MLRTLINAQFANRHAVSSPGYSDCRQDVNERGKYTKKRLVQTGLNRFNVGQNNL